MCKWGTDEIFEIRTESGIKRIAVDSCIAGLVKVLNNNGYSTIASCCGHNKQPSSIIFMLNGEEKEMRIMTFEQARIVDKLFPPIN